jgi:hypothetical protein
LARNGICYLNVNLTRGKYLEYNRYLVNLINLLSLQGPSDTVGNFPAYVGEVNDEIKAIKNEVCHFDSKMQKAKAQMKVARLKQIIEIESFFAKKKD